MVVRIVRIAACLNEDGQNPQECEESGNHEAWSWTEEKVKALPQMCDEKKKERLQEDLEGEKE